MTKAGEIARKILSGQANVILIFENGPQVFYDADIQFALPETNQGSDLEKFEVDVLRQVVSPAMNSTDDDGEEIDMSRLVKISLCYDQNATLDGEHTDTRCNPEFNAAIEYLCRNQAKYYFQPNQRDAMEDLIARTLEIAQNTKDF